MELHLERQYIITNCLNFWRCDDSLIVIGRLIRLEQAA